MSLNPLRFFMLLIGLMLSSSIYAADNQAETIQNTAPGREEQQQLFRDIKQAEQALKQTQRQLQAVQQQVFEKSPELTQKRVALQDKVLDKMSDKNYNARKEMDELNEMVVKYQLSGEKPPLAEIQKYQERGQMFNRKQQQAFLDPEVQKMSQDLQETMEKEVTKLDPNNKQLFVQMKQQIQDLQGLRDQLRKMMAPAAHP